ncbi:MULTISPECIES: LysE/ArgO family amino acid transporter [Glutamicibacter]|uniref:Transporter n=1 Tax=Glutamicibacter ardleyensis TaxID=225894 RepID=A0ABQ2DBC1_9MICC|nr:MULTISPECIES: LysE/ArgO family amino acid transporter [Glutamicibacter]PCC32111.1 amino acid transporter [Glutamicibacter sp. BW77]GGJ52162.1 putative transporter [Glutamicibacter ardleyensis]
MIPAPIFLGFSTGLSLIIAIGSQNAFLLRQGIRREHVLLTVVICAASDVVLILAGVMGIGTLVEHAPWILTYARIGGFIFLLCYSILALKRAVSPGILSTSNSPAPTVKWTVALTALSLTWLNPHVYVDTVILLGSVAVAQHDGKWYFALGAIAASICWFTALGYASRFLSRIFASATSWRILDAIICIFMTIFAVLLIRPLFL